MTALRRFFDGYRSAFARFDRDALEGLFEFPLQVISATDGGVRISVSDRDEWAAVLKELLAAYRSLGVVDAEALRLDVSDLTPEVSSARVHWELRRDDGRAVYDFTAIYTVVEVGGAMRVAAIANDELPKLQAAMSGARNRGEPKPESREER